MHTLGIPHPPGTPLFVLVGRVWTAMLGFVELARAMNVLSAACTVAAALLSARLVLRWTGETAASIAAGLLCGTMATAWLNATETEVYAPALLLAALMVVAGDRAGRDDGWRWVALTGYLIALAVPLHLSAVVAAPAAAVLAAREPSGSWRPGRGIALLGVAVAAVGASSTSVMIGAIGIVTAIAGAFVLFGEISDQLPRTRRALALIGVAVLALTPLLYLYVRAAHDPGLNQGDPSTWSRWVDVVARRQYAVAPLWPRQAPPWLQVANMLQYADWQVAYGIAADPRVSIPRLVASLVFLALGITGAIAHRRHDRRGWLAVLVLLVSGTLGVVLQLNLKAGPSIGWGILPDSAPHEPRERDYFFILGFWSWGLWAGLGAARVLRSMSPRAVVAAPAVAIVPMVLNWSIADRSLEPRASLPIVAARAFLESAPRNAVIFSAGDNDTYPLWYAQMARGIRTDVTVIAIPLLGADWYRAEIARRHGLLPASIVREWAGLTETMKAITAEARRLGRPVGATVSVERSERDMAAEDWTHEGWLWLTRASETTVSAPLEAEVRRLTSIDAESGPALTPAEAYVLDLLRCRYLHADSTDAPRQRSLDSTCNYR